LLQAKASLNKPTSPRRRKAPRAAAKAGHPVTGKQSKTIMDSPIVRIHLREGTALQLAAK
jgi:hypothetical protein